MALCSAHAQGPPANTISLTTADRLEEPGWWPTKGTPPRSQYSGEANCVTCHSRIAAFQHSTPMYHAGVRAIQSEILINNGLLQFKEGGFNTSVTNSPNGISFTVNDGVSTASSPAIWAMGFKKGQTYVLEKDGAYFESRLSFFTSIHSLDITPGQSHDLPDSVEHALGRKLRIDETQRCFGCHTTAAVTSNVFDSESATPGVTCEACHGPGAAHVASMTRHDPEQPAAMMNPADLSPSDSVDFCGACHSTWADVVETNRKIGLSLKYALNPTALSRAAAGEHRATPGLPAWPVTTRISPWLTIRAPMTPSAWRAMASMGDRGEPTQPKQSARWRRAIASPVTCQSTSCRRCTRCSRITIYEW